MKSRTKAICSLRVLHHRGHGRAPIPAYGTGVDGRSGNRILKSLEGAVTEGIVRYAPIGVGILAVGLPACAVICLIHFALGVSAPDIASLGGLTALTHAARTLLSRS